MQPFATLKLDVHFLPQMKAQDSRIILKIIYKWLVTGNLQGKTYARLMYCPVLESTNISSPIFTNNGTLTTAPVSTVAGFDPPATRFHFSNSQLKKLNEIWRRRRWNRGEEVGKEGPHDWNLLKSQMSPVPFGIQTLPHSFIVANTMDKSEKVHFLFNFCIPLMKMQRRRFQMSH